MTGGTFNGGPGNDSVNEMVGAPVVSGRTFNREDGPAFLVDLEGGPFNGGPATIPSPSWRAAPSTRTDALVPRPGTDGRSGALEGTAGRLLPQ